MADVWDSSVGHGSWNPTFVWAFNGWEIVLVENLLFSLQEERVTDEMDTILWKGSAGASFTVNEAFNSLASGSAILFPAKGIWVPNAPTKAAFFAWEAAWRKVLTLDKLRRRG